MKVNSKSHIPQIAILFEKIVPIALIVIGVSTLGLMIGAASVVVGIVHF